MPDQQPPRPLTMADLGTTVKFFEYKDMPARMLSPESWPEVYRVGKGWQRVDDTFDFLHSYMPSTEEAVKAMIQKIEKPPQAQPPSPSSPGAAVPAPAAVTQLSAGHDVTGEKRDEKGEWTKGASAGKSWIMKTPENRTDADLLAAQIRTVVQEIAATRSTKIISSKSEERRGGSTGSSGMCNPVAGAICRLFPDAEVWDGNYDNNPEEFGGHTIFKLGGFFFDVTADQFGREPIAVFAANEDGRPDEGDDSAWPYLGFSKHAGTSYAGPTVDAISDRLKKIV